jgi:aminoglycoside phosphotransferase (APT) family kinase protein
MVEPTLGKLIGSGKEAEVFEQGDLVVKLYRTPASKGSAFREAANLALAESFGLPTPSVRGVSEIDGRWGIVMTRADGPSFAEAVARQPELTPVHLQAMARLQLRVHSQPGTLLASLKARLAANIQKAGMLPETQRDGLLNRLAEAPEGDRLCHGDFHPWNIMGPPGRENLVDWLDACRGDPAADVCRSYVLMRPAAPELAAAYVGAYGQFSRETKERIFGWLPFVAAARLAEGVPSDEPALMEMIDEGR